MYKGPKPFPEHVRYFEEYFSDPDSITKYKFLDIQGAQCLTASWSAKHTDSSNERIFPTKITGMVTPEVQMLELTCRADNWVRLDLKEKTRLELEQCQLGAHLCKESAEFKALMCLYSYPYKRHFVPDW